MRQALLIAIAYAVLAAALYAPSLGGEWVYDDHRFIALNDTLRVENLARFFHDPSTVDPEGGWEGIYRPLRSVSLSIDRVFFDRNPVGYRVHALLLHAATAFAIATLLGRLLRRRRLGYVLGAIHVLLPVHVESVAWVTSRSDLGCALLSVIALIGLRGARPWIGWLALALALFTKEQAVVVPVIAAGLDLFMAPRRPLVPVLRRAVVPVVLVVGYLAVRAVVLGESAGQRPAWGGDLVATMALGLAWYATRMIAPVDFRFDWQMPTAGGWGASIPGHDLPIAPWIVGLAVLGVGVGALWALRRGGPNAIGAGIAWFAVALAPMLNIIPINILVAERFLYLPSVGVLLAAGGVWSWCSCSRQWRTGAGVFVALWCCILGWTTARYANAWSSEGRLWDAVVAHSPNHFRAWAGVAKAHIARGELEPGRAALRRAIALSGGVHAHLYFDLGRTYLLTGEDEKAVPYLRDAVVRWRAQGRGAEDQRYTRTLRSLADAAARAGDVRQATTFRTWLREALGDPETGR